MTSSKLTAVTSEANKYGRSYCYIQQGLLNRRAECPLRMKAMWLQWRARTFVLKASYKLLDKEEPQAKQRNLYFKDVKKPDASRGGNIVRSHNDYKIWNFVLTSSTNLRTGMILFSSSVVFFFTCCHPHKTNFMQHHNRFAGSHN